MTVLHAYNDTYGWGNKLKWAAEGAGIHAELFQNPDAVKNNPDTYAFIHLTHCPISQREKDKQVARKISEKQNVTLIPGIAECEMYDDKLSFARNCDARWMPHTFYGTSQNEAFEALSSFSFPLVSKSREGAGSSNVRLLRNREAAEQEIATVFDGEGIPLFSGNRQKGSVLWQEFCPDNDGDWRVILIGKRYGYILRRLNRPNLPFASGSGSFKPVSVLTAETERLLCYTKEFADEHGFVFLGVDIVYNKKKDPVILETTTGWSLDGYRGCMIFDCLDNLRETGWDGEKNMFDALVKAIKDGNFQ